MDPAVLLIDLSVAAVKAILSNINKSPLTDGLNTALDSGQAFVDALLAHRQDLLTKANFEAQRG